MEAKGVRLVSVLQVELLRKWVGGSSLAQVTIVQSCDVVQGGGIGKPPR